MSCSGDLDEILETVRRAAVCWAAGGAGQPLVDICVDALVAGLDSPILRVLAGAAKADTERAAEDLAERLFEELGLNIRERGSLDAVLEWARQRAMDFRGGQVSARTLTKELYRAYRDNGFPEELAIWSGLDDWYDELGVLTMEGSEADFARAVGEAAELLSGPHSGE